MKTAVIDRFEEDRAVLEVDGHEKVIPRSKLPADAHEGDVVDLDTMQVDRDATERLARELEEIEERLEAKTQKPGSFDL